MAQGRTKDRAAFIGPRLRRMRREKGLTQTVMAEDLGVSPSYIALMERNQRPVTAAMLLRLAATYAVDIAEFAGDQAGDLTERIGHVFKDPMFQGLDLAPSDAAGMASDFPEIADALLRLHAAYREGELALADRTQRAPAGPDPVSEARRFLSARKNFFPVIDDQADRLMDGPRGRHDLECQLKDKFGFKTRRLPSHVMGGAVRRLDHHRAELVLDESLDAAGHRFQIALQLAYLQLGDALTAALAEGSFASSNGHSLAKRALANYAAGAIVMPYRAFHRAAEELRYDVEALSRRFGVSFEQAAHRLTTLQKPGQEGVPFFFIRVDAAGNVSKRLDGGGFPFARHGGSCPLWSVHHTFAAPRQVMPQWLKLPGGERFFSVSRTVTAGGGAYGADQVVRSISLTCRSEHAERLCYAETPDLSPERATPIGVACRLCHRSACAARAEPPIGRPIADDTFRRPHTPFGFTDT